MASEVVDLMRHVPIFRDISPNVLSALATGASAVRYPRETQLFGQGERPEYLYVLLDGSVQLTGIGANAREAVIELVTPVDIFILATVLAAAPSPMGAIVVQPARLVGLPVKAFRAKLTEDHRLALATLDTLAGQSQRTVQQVKNLKLRSSSQRLACYLLELARAANRGTIDLAHDKKLIASYLGMTPESLSRAFNTLRDYGVVNAANKVTLTNKSALRRFCQRPRRHRDRPVHAAPPPSIIHLFPQRHRSRGAGRQGDPQDPR